MMPKEKGSYNSTNKMLNNIILTLFLSTSILAFSQNGVIDEVVAVVGEDAILLSEIEAQFLRMQAEGHSYEGDLKCNILEQLLLHKLLLNQAKIDSIIVNENSIISEVDATISHYIQQIGSKEKMEEYFNKPTAQIKEDLRVVKREQNLTQSMRREISNEITVTPAQVRYHFRNMKKSDLPILPGQIEVEQIVVEPKIDQEETDRIKEQLRGYQQRVQEGSDFSMLAILYSQDEGSARRGGELGFMGKGQLVPAFADVAFSLRDKNKVSRIVESEYGFHIIQLIERRGNRVNCRHILLKPKVSAEAKKVSVERLDSLSKMINNKEIDFNTAARLYSFDKDTRGNGGLLANGMTGSSKFELTQLPPEIAKKVENMKADEISKPFPTINSNGKEVYMIIRLKTKSDSHVANIDQDYVAIKDIYLQEKQESYMEEWIKEKQKEIYISIDEKWTKCDFENKGWVK
jgi:peptidyl-prolyl cis-trans isomerase SurA